MKPSIGRIVHYVTMGSDPLADEHFRAGLHAPAIVAALMPLVEQDESCMLAMFLPGFERVLPIVAAHSEGREPGTWHWPEREEGDAPAVPARRQDGL